ncbi:MAG TPA: helix-turn-helix transcriptional regulator [Pseudoflavonifractor sp.]|nr:helix-turn-helix transcriptional regulator [Pseudoflavonifractor sp.]
MSEEYRNIYKTARLAAGYTQESAAERLGTSVESLRCYETCQRIPPNEMVELMVICYNAQHLAYQHLRESNCFARRLVPSLEERTLLEISVRIFNRLKALDKKNSIERLMDIAEDNVISPEERGEFDSIMADLKEIVRSGMELSIYSLSEEAEQ